MQKPTINKLKGIHNDLKEMLAYFVDLTNERDLNSTEDNLHYHFIEAELSLQDILFYMENYERQTEESN